MRYIKSFINFFQGGNSIRRKVIAAHLFLVIMFFCSDVFDRLFAKTEQVFIVTTVTTSAPRVPQTATTTPEVPLQQATPPPVKNEPIIRPTPPRIPKPKPPVKIKPKTLKTVKPKPPQKNKTKIRSVADIRRSMTRTQRTPVKRANITKILNENSVDTKKMHERFNKAVGSVKVKTSRSSSSRANYNYSSYHSKVYTALFDRWNQPNMSSRLEVTVELVIASNGRLISKKIIDKSGNLIMDNSIKSMLSRLKQLPSLPSTCTDRQHRVTVTFGLTS